MNEYRIILPIYAQTNIDYYTKYDGVKFLAPNDTAAFEIAETLQNECENFQTSDGVELCDLDPCFTNNLYRFTSDKWEKVEF